MIETLYRNACWDDPLTEDDPLPVSVWLQLDNGDVVVQVDAEVVVLVEVDGRHLELLLLDVRHLIKQIMLSFSEIVRPKQCDQIGRFIGLWASF